MRLMWRIAAAFAALTASLPLAADAARERRIDEIAAFLPDKPAAFGVRIGERGFWDAIAKLPEASALVADAANVVREPIPECSDELYLEYSRNGVRLNYERPYHLRTKNLVLLLVAECLENKGRFLGRISDYVEAICSERTWSMPAHDSGLSDFNGKPHVELGSSARAYALSLVCNWLDGVMDEGLRRRAMNECERRIFQPYLMTTRNPGDRTPGHWWYRSKSNWNSVCNSCVVRAALAVVEDRRERSEFVASAEEAARLALAGYLDDGYCEEGMGYWNYGWGHYLAMGLAVRAATGGKVDFFADPKCRRVMLYAYGFQLERGHSPLFADTGRIGPNPSLLALQRLVYDDLPAPDPAPSLLKADSLALALPLFAMWRNEACRAPGRSARLPVRSWFPDAQVLVARRVPSGGGARVSFAVKGGHNDELHNHNDVGSYELMVDGTRIAGDPGGEEYTARTFSKDRYVSKVLNSYGHPVPAVGGRLQGTGRAFAAKVLKTEFTPERDTYVLDLTRAYDCPSLQSLVRTVKFDRKGGRVGIEDKVVFSEPSAFEVPVVTYASFEGDGLDGDLVLRHPAGGRDVRIRATGSAPLTFREEKIPNPHLRTITRLAYAFAEPVTNATLRTVFRVDMKGWRVAEQNNAPGLFFGDKPVAPVLFWQWDVEQEDAKAMAGAGVNLFGIFGSFGHYKNPYWTQDGFAGMAYQDEKLDRLLKWVPDAAFLPRIFAAAPQWWIDANPDEQLRYSNPRARPPNRVSLDGSIPRESFASEKCRRELGAVYREAVRHLYGRYGRHLLGIHLANGPWGENFAWDALVQMNGMPLKTAGFSDVSRPMTERFRRYLREKYGDEARLKEAWKDAQVSFATAEVPPMAARLALDEDGVWRNPAKGRRIPDYFECMNAVTVEMLDYYGGIVKEETDLPVLAFYGYTQDERWAVESDHRAVSKMYRLKNVDMFSAPHTYHRRSPGEDGSMRCYLASAALHGKFFLDEGDDMTHLEQLKKNPDGRCSATNAFESVNLLYREFGMAVTHGVGLWYMDLKRDTFRSPELVAAVGQVRKAADLALAHDRAHRSEVAVVSNVESEFYMGYRGTDANTISEFLYRQQMGAFYRAGAPFDWYLAEDLDAVVARNYKVVVFLDCQYMTEHQREQVEALKANGRTLVFFHAPGYVSETDLSRTRMEAISGVKTKPGTVCGVLSAVDAATGREWGCGLDHVIDGVGDRSRGVRHLKPGTVQKGLFLPDEGETLMTGVGNLAGTPVAVRKAQSGWTTAFSALPAMAPDVLRNLYREAGVHVYTDEDVVLSANSAWLMLHTRKRGDYAVRLPRQARRVLDVTNGDVIARDCDKFTCELEKFQTAVYLIEE